MVKSLCKGKRVTPNKCKKLRGCKVARGTKRSFCRKAKNKTMRRGGKTCKNKQQNKNKNKNKNKTNKNKK